MIRVGVATVSTISHAVLLPAFTGSTLGPGYGMFGRHVLLGQGRDDGSGIISERYRTRK